MKSYLYQLLTDSLRNEIKDGQRSAGERMPSLRALCAARNLSKSTVLSAYGQLEAEGLLESRPRSGYFVRLDLQQTLSAPVPQRSDPEIIPLQVSTEQVVIDIMEKGAAFDLLTGDERDPQKNKKTNVELRRCLTRAHRRQSGYDQNYYNPPQGLQLLREQIVTRLHAAGSHLQDDDIAITSGCQNSLLLALMATTRPGDVVAIESPGFYGAIHLLEALGLQILELASDPVTGVNVDLLAIALERWEVSALIVSPSYSTPTGACMSEASKQAMLALCLGHGVAIIEDDIYRELHFGVDSPRTLHSYDHTGSVLLCSSFSKTLSRDLRIGWIAPGKYKEQIKRLKIVTSLATSNAVQLGVAEYMQRGLLDRHLRQLRSNLARQCRELQDNIPVMLPMAVSWTQPRGGLSLWLELPLSVKTTDLYWQARRRGITVTPGALFSSQSKYSHFLRLSFLHQWSAPRLQALKTLASLLEES